MSFDFPRALGLGVVLYLILFIVGMIVMYLLGIPYLNQVMIFANPLFSIPLAYIYLRQVRNEQFLESVRLGVLWIILTILLDVLVFVQFFETGWTYYNNPLVWIGYGELVFFNMIIGGLLEGTKELA